MDEIWTRLETFLKQNAPEVYGSLAPGATEAEIADAEVACGVTFPPDVRQSYLRHDGQLGDYGNARGGTFIPCCFGLLPLKMVLYRWQTNQETLQDLADEMPDGGEASPGVQPVFLDIAWVPIAKEHSGADQICLDFNPATGGRAGQLIEFRHEADGQQLIAPDFRTWLGEIADELESGRLVWNEELTGYCYPEDL